MQNELDSTSPTKYNNYQNYKLVFVTIYLYSPSCRSDNKKFN